MFKLLIMSLIFACCFAGGCASSSGAGGSAPERESFSGRKISISIGEKKAILLLNNSEAAERLYNSLPLTLEFGDYNSTEKIAYPPEPLHKQLSSEGHQPAAGDLCLYAPWGNLCLFYRGYRESKDLFFLGRLESGLQYFTGNEKFTAVLDKAE